MQFFFYYFFSIIMDFADDGDLLQKIQGHLKANTHFRESDIWNIYIQVNKYTENSEIFKNTKKIINKKYWIIFENPKVVKGLKSMHDLKIYHRDLKVKFFF